MRVRTSIPVLKFSKQSSQPVQRSFLQRSFLQTRNKPAQENQSSLTEQSNFTPFGHSFGQVSVQPPRLSTIQAKSNSDIGASLSPRLITQIQNLHGKGQPLPNSERRFFEPRFDRDFSQVKIHTDRQAAEIARSIQARAFTLGSDIGFGTRQYEPETSWGRRLLAHELTHVVQHQGNETRIQRATKPPDSNKNQKIYVVITSNALIRTDPPQFKSTGKKIPRGVQVEILQTESKGRSQFVLVQEVLPKGMLGPANVWGWTAKSNLVSLAQVNLVEPKLNPANQKLLSDDDYVNQIIEKFGNAELKKQIGKKVKNRRNFLLGMQLYLGSLENVIAHFQQIQKFSEFPGEINLHKKAGERLKLVAAKLGGAKFMPATTVALGLRGRYHPHKRNSKGLMAHPMGYAIDYRATTNPHITDPRLVKLIEMQIGGSISFELGMSYSQRRQLLKRMGQQMEAGGIDPSSKLGQQAATFFERFEAEYHRLSTASQKFTTEIPAALTQAKETIQNLKQVNRELKRLRRRKRRAKSNQRQEEIAKQEQKLLEEKGQLEQKIIQIKSDLPKLFKPWLDRIRAEIERLERSVTDVELSSIELPTKKEARTDKNKLNRAKSSLTRQKRRLTGKIQKLERRIARASKQHQSSSESILEWESQLQQLQSDAELQNVSGRQRSLERKIKILERRIAKAHQRQEKRSQAIAKWKTQLTSHQTAIKQDIETQLAQTSEKLKQLNRIEELRPIKNDWNVLTSLEKALKTDEQFIFVGQRSVQNPSVMQLIEKGFFTPDPEVEEGKKFLPHRHGFNLAFMKLMAQHGFEQGINWSPGSTDPMHFELVEGVDSLLSAPKLGK